MGAEKLEGKEVEGPSDICALGGVIYEMATGKPAFTGNSRASLVAAILSSEPQPMVSLQAMTPPMLERAVRRCLAKDPDERWQSASDLANELDWVAEGSSQAGVPASARTGPQRWERSSWLLAAMFLMLLLAVDRKSTRLNSSHQIISYAVFCLKK